MIVHRYRLKSLNNEYLRVFCFFDVSYNYKCPNPRGRCVGKYQNAKIHWLNGQYHRINNPAIEYANGDKFWYYEGQLHRPLGEGPAIEFANGTKYWYYEEQLHRPLGEGPAIEYANGEKELLSNGK